MEEIVDPGGTLVALTIKTNEKRDGVQFITPHESNPQLALMRRPAGEYIKAHVHLPIKRVVYGTPEVLIISKGRMRVDFFTNQREYFTSREVTTGDVLVLFSGGHGFLVLEETEMIELKQGPFTPGRDKEKFDGRTQVSLDQDES